MVAFIVRAKFVLSDLKTRDRILFERGTIHAVNELDKCNWQGLSQKQKLFYLENQQYITICTNLHDTIKSLIIKDYKNV